MAIKKKQQDFFFKVRTLGKHKKMQIIILYLLELKFWDFQKKPQNPTEISKFTYKNTKKSDSERKGYRCVAFQKNPCLQSP